MRGEEKMKAGRELDRLVAEKVMGLDLDEFAYDTFKSWRNEWGGKGISHSEPYDQEKYRDRMLSFAVPHYSTDISAAWEVVSAMVEKGLGFRLTVEYDRSCEARFYLWEDGIPVEFSKEYVTSYEDAPHAICLAALEAIGEAE